LRASAINHSCAPNACQTFIGNKIYIRTTAFVPCGHEITISYIDCAMTTKRRRAELQGLYGFSCDCSRCSRQISSNEEYWRCLVPRCPGRLEVDADTIGRAQYRSWIIAQNCAPGSMHTCLQCTHSSEHTATMEELVPAMSQLSAAVQAGNQPSSTPQERIGALTRAQEICERYILSGSYTSFEIVSALCREYLINEMFVEAERLTGILCNYTSSLYPSKYHPQVAVLFLQKAKLLLYLRGAHDERTRVSQQDALDIMIITHHPDHSLFSHCC